MCGIFEEGAHAGNGLVVKAYRCVGVAARNRQNRCARHPHCGRLSPGARFARNATVHRAGPTRREASAVSICTPFSALPFSPSFSGRSLKFAILALALRCFPRLPAECFMIGFARSAAFRCSAFSSGARISGARCSTCADVAAAAITFFASGEGAIVAGPKNGGPSMSTGDEPGIATRSEA